MDELEKINRMFIDIEGIKLSIARLIANAESERDVRRDTHMDLNKKISDIDKLMRDVFYDHERGFLVRIDRLTQESIERKKMKQNIIGLWISLIITAVSFALSLLIK